MVSSEFILHVDERSFEFEVIYYSKNIPVLAVFWADWSQSSKQLIPLLENAVTEADGGLRLAKVDADSNQLLAMQYQVRSLPTVLAFHNGKNIGEFSGLISQDQLDEFIEALLPPSQIELDLEKGISLLNLHKWSEAEDIFKVLMQSEDCPPAALLGLAKSLIPQGKISEALMILKKFPASKEYRQAESLLPLVVDMNSTIQPESDLDLMYFNSLKLVARGNLLAALDGLLEILNINKNFRKGNAKFAFLGILEILGDQDLDAKNYREELSTILFK
ncbi:MAG: tetratricopeptide repeat protein [Chloroflexi bacterium]|nr:tetratricopeptide repeat protein [Chloroflexota bacterium]